MADENSTIVETPQQPAAEPTVAEYRAEREAEIDQSFYRGRAHDALPSGEAAPKERNRGYQRRIDELTRRNGDLERELTAERARNAQPAAQPQPGTQQQPGAEAQPGEKPGEGQQPQGKPKDGQQPSQKFGVEAILEHPTHQQRMQAFASELNKGFAANAEDKAAFESTQLHLMAQIALPHSPAGVEIARHIARNPALAEKINLQVAAHMQAAADLSGGDPRAVQVAGLRTAAMLIDSLAHALQWGTLGKSAGSGPVRYIERPVSSAPSPITPVGGGSGAGPEEETDPDKMSIAQYRAQRERSRNPRRG